MHSAPIMYLYLINKATKTTNSRGASTHLCCVLACLCVAPIAYRRTGGGLKRKGTI